MKLQFFNFYLFSLTFATEQIHYDGMLKTIDQLPTGECKVTAQEGDLVTFLSWGYLRNGVLFDVGEYEIKVFQFIFIY